METEIARFESIVRGLVISTSDRRDEASVDAIFEVGRRYKMANPSKMRNTYGKMMWLLQDRLRLGQGNDILEISTVRSFLGDQLWTQVVNDPLFLAACSGSASGPARKLLAEKYAGQVSDIERVVDSCRDFFALERELLEPVQTLRTLLKEFFASEADLLQSDVRWSLSIRAGVNGARLTHSHRRQYDYVLQSFTLWEEVLKRFMVLWHRAEKDMLKNSYRLMDTGQGLNRVQSAPSLMDIMQRILSHTQGLLDGGWVGSSVIHLGDHNVPNALFFIDKYSQIPRILGPVAHVVSRIETEYETRWDDQIRGFVDRIFGGPKKAKIAILADFFKHAFDGSGADNFFDAGSCIDGRLTSAWNWCSKIEKKSFYPLFLLCGFSGFDGNQGW
jgi:hypothetical protein